MSSSDPSSAKSGSWMCAIDEELPMDLCGGSSRCRPQEVTVEFEKPVCSVSEYPNGPVKPNTPQQNTKVLYLKAESKVV